MVGGGTKIAENLDPECDKPLALNFHPEDLTSRSVISYNKKGNNVLLKVTVPKRTGRKRKLGSSDEFTEDPGGSSHRKDARYLLRSMRDNPQGYRAEAVGQIHTTHVWRALPDFVYSSTGSAFFHQVDKTILKPDYEEVKDWSRTWASNLPLDNDTIPPPVFSTQTVPHVYNLRQNQVAKTSPGILTRQAARSTDMSAQPPQNRHVEEEQVEVDHPRLEQLGVGDPGASSRLPSPRSESGSGSPNQQNSNLEP